MPDGDSLVFSSKCLAVLEFAVSPPSQTSLDANADSAVARDYGGMHDTHWKAMVSHEQASKKTRSPSMKAYHEKMRKYHARECGETG